MSGPDWALMTVSGGNGAPSVEDAAAQLGVETKAVDPAFGVVPIDPEKGIYCVQVAADALPAETPAASGYRGPFSNPKIEPFGPPQTRKDE